MKYLKIQNKGELDIRLIALMGGTTKTGNDYKIGQFGTGLKYSLAYLLRNNLDFHILIGEKEAKIHLEREVIKEENFDIICIDNKRTSITTKMGLEWMPWMIVRELWCNALDEGEASKDEFDYIIGSDTKFEGKDGYTTFYIQITKEVKEVMDNWSTYFIHNVQPLFENGDYSIYPGGNDLRIYKQGVLISQQVGKRCLFNYGYKRAEINELREFKGSTSQVVFQSLRNMNEKLVTYFLETVKEHHFEGSTDCDYSWYDSFGESWKVAIGESKLIHTEAIKSIHERGLTIDTEGMLIVPKQVYEALTKNFDGIGALRTSQGMNEFYETFNQEVDAKVKQGLVILEQVGYYFNPELKFVFGVFGDKYINAQINVTTKEVYISDNFINKSLFEICAILIEESEHFNTHFSDCTRQFQQHFINLYTQQLLKNGGVEL